MSASLWIFGPDPTSSRRRKHRKLLVNTMTYPVSGAQYESAYNSRYVITFTCEKEKYIEFYWRYGNSSNYFLLQQDSDTGDLYINKKVVGTPTILHYAAEFFEADVAYTVVVEAENQYHGITINDSLIYERIDPMLPVEPGLRIYHSYATNDIVIKVYS